jgi:adenosylcobinamide-GDP ribazoletransferase
MKVLPRFLISLQYFTRIPIPAGIGFDPDWLRHASGFFPLVGLIVGAVCAGVYTLAAGWLPPAVAVLLSMIAGAWLTRAMHEDGFADVCDGFGGGWERERVLAIMKDSCVGSFGLVGMALLLALKYQALVALPGLTAALLFAHPVSRLMATLLIWRLDYARSGESKASAVARHMSHGDFALACVTGLLPAWGLAMYFGAAPRALALALFFALLATGWLARLFVRRIGGYTGDCLGAVQQVSEVALYLGLLLAVNF